MTENKRFVCYFDNIVKKWCVQDTDSLDIHYVADEPMGDEFAHLLNLYHQTLDNVEKENEELKTIISNYMDCIDKLAIENGKLKGQLKIENYSDFLNSLVEKNEQLSEENKRLVKMLDNVANYMQKQNKNMAIDDFVEWWNNITTEGLMND